MTKTFYFYDLETSGISPHSSRIMQFGGQRTDMDLKPIGPPDNILIKLTTDILPDPDAVMITGISPQVTLADGISEVEFLNYFYQTIATPNTIFVGFNSVRFDDEFIRYTNYRNFYDAYEWQWQQSRSKWDMLDVSRMMRALRPDGIKWPFTPDGKPTNSLVYLTSINDLSHNKAHDALSDVNATIALARLIKLKQPKLFEYLLDLRDKKKVAEIVNKPEAFVYTSGRYSGDYLKTTAVITIAPHPTQNTAVFVYDLRQNPKTIAKKSPAEIAEQLTKYRYEEGEERLPIKQLQLNRCPAIAPLGVLDAESIERLKLNMDEIQKNAKALLSMGDLSDRIQEAAKLTEAKKQKSLIVDALDVDLQLYDGFFNEDDKTKMRVVRVADQNELADLNLDFADSRLEKLLLLYKARQFPASLTPDEQQSWEAYKISKLLTGDEQSRVAKYFNRLNEISLKSELSQDQIYLLEELKLYGESIVPA